MEPTSIEELRSAVIMLDMKSDQFCFLGVCEISSCQNNRPSRDSRGAGCGPDVQKEPNLNQLLVILFVVFFCLFLFCGFVSVFRGKELPADRYVGLGKASKSCETLKLDIKNE